MTFKDYNTTLVAKPLVQEKEYQKSTKTIATEIIEGLQSENKYISSKFFYNKKGSILFEEITKLDEYYPTRTEKQILKSIAPHLFGNIKNTQIIELGSGDSSKISILLKAIPKENLNSLTYIPVDVSNSAIEKSINDLKEAFPLLTTEPVVADFLENFNYLKSSTPKLICFLGSTIGNLSNTQAQYFINNIAQAMGDDDRLLIGMDMVKDIPFIEKAYNDNKGITAKFNLNILNAVNEITGSDFDPNKFEHSAFYNKQLDRIEMHLIAKESIQISISPINQSIFFNKGESIHTENSHKFTKHRVDSLIKNNQLDVKEIFTDNSNYFSLYLFSK